MNPAWLAVLIPCVLALAGAIWRVGTKMGGITATIQYHGDQLRSMNRRLEVVETAAVEGPIRARLVRAQQEVDSHDG